MHAQPQRDQTIISIVWGLTLLSVCSGCATLHLGSHATPADLPAFVQVDEGFLRGGQPTMSGIEQLSQRGVKTIISLRQHSAQADEERRAVQRLGMRWVSLPMWFWWRPSDRQVREFLTVVNDPANRPVFVHCRQGRNRVGIMTAIYRMVHDGWTAQQAYAEGRQLGLVAWNIFSKHLLFYGVPRMFLTHPSSSQRGGRHPVAWSPPGKPLPAPRTQSAAPARQAGGVPGCSSSRCALRSSIRLHAWGRHLAEATCPHSSPGQPGARLSLASRRSRGAKPRVSCGGG